MTRTRRRHLHRLLTGLAVAGALLLAACGGGGDDAAEGPATSPPPTSAPPDTSPPGGEEPPPLGDLRATEVAVARDPVTLTTRSGDDGLWIGDKSGTVRVLRGGELSDPVLSLAGEVSTGGEQGLLGIAFSPDGGRLYLSYTDTDGTSRLHEVRMEGDEPQTDTRRELLSVAQPFANHNGGHVAFGPEGYLWLGLGDGGSAGDPHDNAQSLDTLLGKLLRIDPEPADGAPYGVPPDNPFVDREGARPEIWAYGLRNPWRFSFDADTDDLWIADVGQNRVEEINREPAGSEGGRNYGWNRLEGTHPFEGEAPPDAIPPVHEYPLEGGRCAVVGGRVYRGEAIPGLVGSYVFTDNCEGHLYALRLDDGRVVERLDLGLDVPRPTAIGVGADGELYVASLDGPVLRLEPAV